MVDFITKNPVAGGFDRTQDRRVAEDERDRAAATDAATRSGLNELYAGPAPNAQAAAPNPAAPASAAPAPPPPRQASTVPPEYQAKPFDEVLEIQRTGGLENMADATLELANRETSIPPNFMSLPDERLQQYLQHTNPQIAMYAKREAARRSGALGAAEQRFAEPPPPIDLPMATAQTRPGQPAAAGAQDAGVYVTPNSQAPVTAPGAAQPPMDPVMRNLAATPGGGAAAMERHSSLQGRNDEMEKMAMQALANDDLVTFQNYAGQIGLEVPQQFLNDSNARRLFGAGSLIADKYYGDASPEQAMKFAMEFLSNGGDYARAFEVAGTPPQQTSGKEPADQKMVQFLEGRGIPFEQAVEIVTSAKTNNPATAQKIWTMVYDNSFGSHEERSALAKQSTDEFLQQYGGGNWTAVTGGGDPGGAPGGQPAPAPAQRYDPATRSLNPVN